MALLNDVAKFKPLADWMTKYRPTEFSLSVLTVRSVQKLSQRISSVVFEVTLVSKNSKEDLVQTVTLCDEPAQCVLLPIANVEGTKYAILASANRVPLGAKKVEEAFTGYFQKDGAFECVSASALLPKVGYSLNEKFCQGLSEEEISLGDEGFPAVRPVFMEKNFSKSEFLSYFGPGAEGVSTADGSSLVAYPVAEVAEHSSDLKALVATSLFIAKNAN